MKKHVILFLILMWKLCQPAYGRIGETPEQCILRYGKPINILKYENAMHFKKWGYLIFVKFKNNIGDSISYQKEAVEMQGSGIYAIGSIPESELLKIMKANGGNRDWKVEWFDPKWTAWRTTDEQLFARYDSINMTFGIIKTDPEKQAQRNAKEETDF